MFIACACVCTVLISVCQQHYTTGTLCGECRGNGSHSVGVLRTTCRLCDEEHFYALGFLVVADVVVPLLLLFASVKISLPFPPSLRGLLFYLQTVYYATEYFPASFWDIRKYMLCISSLLGLYFPWDFCLYPGNSALVVHSTYFIPSLLSLACVVGVLLCSKMSRRKVWDGVLSLVLLLYAPLVHTCVSLLFCPALPGEYAHNNSTVPRWFLNAEVRCFSTPLHTFLGLLAIAVLIALTAMSLIFLLLVCCKGHKRLKDKRLIETLTNALRQGYRDQVDWWMAFDLFRRLVFITVLVVLPGRTVAPLYVLMFLLATHLLVQPYKRAWQNAIEAAVLINFTFLLLLRSIQTFLEQQELYFGVSIPLSWSGSLSRVDRLTMMFFVWFYLPLAVGVAMLLSWVPYKIWEFHSSKKKYTVTKTRRRTTRIKTFTTDEWNAVGGSAGKAPSTTVVELTPQPPEGEGEGDLCDDSFEDSYSYSQGSGQGNVSL